MYEVEVKVPADHGRVRERLADAGAVHEGTVAQADTYFDAPHRNFAATDEAFRVRRIATATPDFDPAADFDGADDSAAVVERADDLAAAVDAVLDGAFHASGETRVTYKGPLVEAESKTREEFETTVGDADAMVEIAERLGFEPVATVRKLRARYRLDGFTVLLDAVEGVGDYVEVETAVATEAEVEAAREAAHELLRELGLDPDDQVRTSYLGLLLGDA